MGDGERTALVLSGGGARGAYEVGVLSVLLPELEARGERPSILVGTSVGAINAAALASTAHLSAEQAMERELDRWGRVDRAAVIRPVIPRVPLTGLRFVGGMLGIPGVRLESLLDPSPLEKNLKSWIGWPRLHRNLTGGAVGSLGIVATAARTGRPVAFVEGELRSAARNSHVIDYVAAKIGQTHVRASAAIPILFPPVRVTTPAAAAGWYVDGGTRLNTPIKPAIDLGADRVVVIGTGSVTPVPKHEGRHDAPPPDFGVSAAHLLEGALGDPLVEDLRKLGDINTFSANGSSSATAVRHRRSRGRPEYRPIPYIFVGPSHPGAIAELAMDIYRSRYGGLKAIRSLDLAALSRLLGRNSPTHGELLSYLFFDPEFIKGLMEMGSIDARAWLDAPPGPSEPWQLEPLEALARPAR
ncbi:MAG TPA: patatin-like phospholipase family protein [Solirubrobacteraceae bacterium]|nr:patatin-like phospholipase family protein [Solirubrobacteraceae bacterium]